MFEVHGELCKRSLLGYKCSLTVDAEMLNMTNGVFFSVLMFLIS